MKNFNNVCLLIACSCLFPPLAGADSVDSIWGKAYIGADPSVLYLPDAHANYWRYGWLRKPGETGGLVIKGKFPEVRYFSYNVYNDETKSTLGSFADEELKADHGGGNTFAGEDPDGEDTYTIYVVPEGSKIDKENVLYFPDDVSKVSVMLRHYDSGGLVGGGVPLPSISTFSVETGEVGEAPPGVAIPKISRIEIQRYLIPMFKKLESKFKEDPVSVLEHLSHRNKEDSLKINELICKQVVANTFTHFHPGEVVESYRFATSGTYPNKDNLYLVMPAVRTSDEVLLVKFKAPPYPRSAAEYPAAPLRYFSLSQGDDITYGFGTAMDKEIKLSDDGYAYFLIGNEGPELEGKSDSLGANFMPWKAKEKLLLVYRHMLPRADYPHGVNQVPFYSKEKPEKGQEGSAFIGDYAPTGKLISEEAALDLTEFPTFE